MLRKNELLYNSILDTYVLELNGLSNNLRLAPEIDAGSKELA